MAVVFSCQKTLVFHIRIWFARLSEELDIPRTILCYGVQRRVACHRLLWQLSDFWVGFSLWIRHLVTVGDNNLIRFDLCQSLKKSNVDIRLKAPSAVETENFLSSDWLSRTRTQPIKCSSLTKRRASRLWRYGMDDGIASSKTSRISRIMDKFLGPINLRNRCMSL